MMTPTPTSTPCSCLYVGEVTHHRLRPHRHRFVYRTAYLLLDLNRLAELDQSLRLFSFNRPNLVSFQERDHGARDGSPLRPWVEAQLVKHGIVEAVGSILLLCMPRWLGHVFNPLSIYYCFDRSGRLAAVIYEVKNTFGEQHVYVLPVGLEQRGENRAIRQSCTKAFYVSPFIEMAAHYRFKLGAPGEERLSAVIQQSVRAEPLLVASLTGRRRPLTDGQLLLAGARYPTHKVLAAIHWEALRLWLKGVPLQPRPETAAKAVESCADASSPPQPNAGMLLRSELEPSTDCSQQGADQR